MSRLQNQLEALDLLADFKKNKKNGLFPIMVNKIIGAIIFNQEGNTFKAFGNVGKENCFETSLFKLIDLDKDYNKVIFEPLNICKPHDSCIEKIVIDLTWICAIQLCPISIHGDINKRAPQRKKPKIETCKQVPENNEPPLNTPKCECQIENSTSNNRMIIPFSEIKWIDY
nr:hypothetical protein [Fredinandcohnia onubensis]